MATEVEGGGEKAEKEKVHTLIFLGHPGAGKGTQAGRLAREHGFEYFEMGGILRKEAKEETERGRMIDEMVNQKAQMVPDELVNEIIRDRLAGLESTQKVIIDSHPRNMDQLKILDQILEEVGRSEFLVIFIDVSDEEAKRRLLSRRICSGCTNVTMGDYKGPDKELCDKCGGEMIKRKDDTPEKIAKRQEWSHQNLDPIIANYKDRESLQVIDGEREIDEVYKDVVNELKGRQII
jgi:adenylate kinase